jgi:hypothetical protein
MDVNRLAAAARVAVGVAIAALSGGTVSANAAPLDPPPPCPDCQQEPGPLADTPAPPPPHVLQPYTPQPPVFRVGPGGPKGGGGQPMYLQPHHHTPAPPPPAAPVGPPPPPPPVGAPEGAPGDPPQ